MRQTLMRQTLCMILVLSGAALAWGADDPSIQEPLRGEIRSAMVAFIDAATVDGVVRLYDPITDEVLALSDVDLHSGIVKKGDFYVSCADFTDATGREIDVDYLVVPSNDGMRAVQAIVHKIDGEKRPYDLED